MAALSTKVSCGQDVLRCSITGHKTGWLRFQFCTDVSQTSINKVNTVTVDENVQRPRIKFVKTQLLFQIKCSPRDVIQVKFWINADGHVQIYRV